MGMARNPVAPAVDGSILHMSDHLPSHEPSFWSQVPGWVIPAVLAAVFALVLSPKVIRAGWRRIRRSPPVDVHVETDLRLIFANAPDWISFPQFVPLPKEDLPPPPPGHAIELAGWAERLGGLPADLMHLDVIITAREDCHVVVQRFRIRATSAALPDGCVVVKAVGGASMEFRRIDIRLSTTGSTTRFTAPGGSATAPFEFQLHPGESAKFSLIVTVDYSDEVDLYEWEGVLDLLCRGKTISIPVNDGGAMFSLVHGRGHRRCVNEGGPEAGWR
jgi:hypothetical protein